MHWVLQDNIFNEDGFERLLDTLVRLDLSHSIHKVIPFCGDLLPEPQIPDGQAKVIVMGSYSMANYAARKGWTPGSFIGPNLDFEIQLRHWGNRMINCDSLVTVFGQVPESIMPFFIRPTTDTKSFNGQVIDWPSFVEWRDSVLKLTPEDGACVTADTPVMVNSHKEIYSETRTWVVDGKVITASGYKVGTIKRLNAQVDQRIIEYANECAQWWSPCRAYVLDIFDTSSGLRIGEVNNINSAGFYEADMNKLVMKLEEAFS